MPIFLFYVTFPSFILWVTLKIYSRMRREVYWQNASLISLGTWIQSQKPHEKLVGGQQGGGWSQVGSWTCVTSQPALFGEP